MTALPAFVSCPLLCTGLYTATLATCLGCPLLALAAGLVAALAGALMGVS